MLSDEGDVCCRVAFRFALKAGAAVANEWREYGHLCLFSPKVSSAASVMVWVSRDGSELVAALREEEEARFVQEVNRMMGDGWQPLGGVAADMSGFCRAMVK